MFWSYDTLTYSNCSPCIVLSDLPYVKNFKAVYSVKTKTKANLSRNIGLTTGIGASIDVKDV